MEKIPSLKRILIVEDDVDIQVIMEVALSDIGGFEVAICGRSEKVLEHVAQFQPDLILLDLMMPHIDGFTTLKSLRSAFPSLEIPVIFVTAKTSIPDLSQYQKMGVLDVIPKPFNAMNLSTLIQKIWENAYGH
jgi:two-component system OmpR family response regulator